VQTPRDVLTPNSFSLLQAVAEAGSFAAAARQLGLVPSAVTYRVRQIEDALDVLLFDRASRQAVLTEAGAELLREGARLLGEIDAVSNRVRRVATGWEPQFTIAVDSVVSLSTMMDLVQAFYELKPPTRLRLRNETLSGTLEALTSGQADLALGIPIEPGTAAGLQSRMMGELAFVYAVAPHHPLASAAEPLTDDMLNQHRAGRVDRADHARQGGSAAAGPGRRLRPGADGPAPRPERAAGAQAGGAFDPHGPHALRVAQPAAGARPGAAMVARPAGKPHHARRPADRT
jgi:DNA-binding transcriptional LysR family regulator